MSEGLYTLDDVIKKTSASLEEIELYISESLINPALENGERFFTPDDISKIKMIKRLIDELEVNIPGVAVILNMRQQMIEMQEEFEQLFENISRGIMRELSEYRSRVNRPLIESRSQRPSRIQVED